MPEAPGACPSAPELADFHEGRLTQAAALRLTEHVEACAACCAELAELALDNLLTGELRDLFPGGPPASRSARPAETASDPERQALVALLRESAEGERYEVLGELGHGGMGVVYEVHDRVLQRKLAMKVAGAGGRKASSAASPTGRRLARFLAEVRITAQLDHPSIIPVHELGIDAQGRAFFTMRKVRGQDLHAVLEEFERGEGEWTLNRLVGVVQRACDALAYAHSKRVVHRDLKPANIMVGRFSAVYVMDWGVAKLVGREADGSQDAASTTFMTQTRLWSLREGQEDDSPSSLMTLEGEVLGTPAYMAPEQALAAGDELDSRADVYSMGAILYRLLSGRTPYHDAVGGGTPHTAWKRLLEGPPEQLTEIAPKAPPELVAVCERAMARNPAARYADMADLTADLRAWLEGRVVRAHRTGVVVEARKWIRRNRALAGAGLLGLTLVPSLLVRHSVVEGRTRDAAARATGTIAAQRLLDVDPAQALRLAIGVVEAEQNYLSRTALLAALVPLAQDAFLYGVLSNESSTWSTESVHRAWSDGPAGAQFVLGGREPDGDHITIKVWDVKAGRFTEESFESPPTENHIVFDPHGRRIASGGTDGSLSIHDRSTGESLLLACEGGLAHEQAVARLAFDPSGELLASASWDGSVRLWDAASGALVRSLSGHRGIVSSIDFDATGARLLSASGPPMAGFTSDDTARVWDVASGTCLRVFEGHEGPLTSARFAPFGDLVLSTSYDRTAQLWDAGSGDVQRRIPLPGKVWDGAFTRDGSKLAVAFDAGFLVQDVQAGGEVRMGPFEAHDGRAVTEVEFSPRGDRLRLLTIGRDRVGRVWEFDAEGRARLALRLRGQVGKMQFGSWSPDGSAIATSHYLGTRLWFAEGNQTTDRVRPAERPATRARFHPDGDRVLLTFEDSQAYEYGFTPGRGLHSRKTLGVAHALDVATTADGALTLVAEDGGRLRLWRQGPDGASRETDALELDVRSLHPSPVNELVGAILSGGGAAVLEFGGVPAVTRLAESEPVNAIRFSADGRRVALGTADGALRVIDLVDDRVLLDEQLPQETTEQRGVFDVCFYDAGRRLLSAGPKVGVKEWDVADGRFLRELGRAATTGGLLVLQEGQRLLTSDMWDFGVSRVELAGDRAPVLLHPSNRTSSHDNSVTAWSLDRAQQRLLTTSLDHAATVWDLDTEEPWVTFAGHGAPVLAGDLSRDGRWAVTADATGRVHVWPVDPLLWADDARPVQTGPRRR